MVSFLFITCVNSFIPCLHVPSRSHGSQRQVKLMLNSEDVAEMPVKALYRLQLVFEEAAERIEQQNYSLDFLEDLESLD